MNRKWKQVEDNEPPVSGYISLDWFLLDLWHRISWIELIV